MAKYYQGKFRPKHPEKYNGDHSNICYRSGWELNYMMKLDKNPNIIEWQSEELIIPYRSPVDNYIHRYFPDFRIKERDSKGKIKTTVIEIKPLAQTIQPKPKKRVTKRFLNEIMEYSKNQAKWEAATEYCLDRGWTFQILTEKELGIKF